MLKLIRRAVCSHSFSWSERRKGEVCIRCGRFQGEQARKNTRSFHGH